MDGGAMEPLRDDAAHDLVLGLGAMGVSRDDIAGEGGIEPVGSGPVVEARALPLFLDRT
jgi:hypothetical protein